MAMKQLKDYLGTWKYTHASADKFYKVEPWQNSLYKITWGDSLANLGKNKRLHVVDAAEAFRRIRDKAKGGYSLVEPYSGIIPKSAEMSVEVLYPAKPKSVKKTQPKKKFTFTDWLLER